VQIHFVHYNTKYASIGEALGHKDDGLAVLGVFAEVTHITALHHSFTVVDVVCSVCGQKADILPIRRTYSKKTAK